MTRISGIFSCEVSDSEVCYLARDPALFDGTLASNLRFVRPAVADEILDDAARTVGLATLVRELPEGLCQRIGPDGCQLSGGQRQRLALARALLQQPGILILDEATSCLDASSEILVLNRIRESLKGSTVVVISHRLTTLAGFPRLLVLSGGQIIHDGSPKDVFVPICGLTNSPVSTAADARSKIQ